MNLPSIDAHEKPPELLGISRSEASRKATREAIAMLKPNQRIAAWALATGETMTKAAKLAKVTRRTIYGWKTQESFQIALDAGVDLFSSISEPARAATHARILSRCPEVGDRLIETALSDGHPDQFRAISKALEVAGLAGGKNAPGATNVQVNVSVPAEIQARAAEIIEAARGAE